MNPLLQAAIVRIVEHGEACACTLCRPTSSPAAAFEAGILRERARMVVQLRARILEAERVGLAPMRPVGFAEGGELTAVRGGIHAFQLLVRELERQS